jgi:HK97 gp10 family phage protein
MGIHVDGIEQAIEKFDRLDTVIRSKEVVQIFQLCGDFVADAARELVHVRSGELRDAIFARAYTRDTVPYVIIGVELVPKDGHAGVPYGHRIEFGGAGHPAYPFLRPAAEQSHEQIMRIAGEALTKLIQGAVS